MALTLFSHPLASFCHKVLLALYENDTPFENRLVDFADPGDSARFIDMWPVGKIPVLRDEARDALIPETSIIIDYLDQHYPGPVRLIPEDADGAREARLWDRFFDCYVMQPMQKIVIDRIRPADAKDPFGVEEAYKTLATAYGMIEKRMANRAFASGDAYSIADCAATPSLFYAGVLSPFASTHPHLSDYFERLIARPSFQRILAEAQPYFKFFPYREKLPDRFILTAAT